MLRVLLCLDLRLDLGGLSASCSMRARNSARAYAVALLVAARVVFSNAWLPFSIAAVSCAAQALLLPPSWAGIAPAFVSAVWRFAALSAGRS